MRGMVMMAVAAFTCATPCLGAQIDCSPLDPRASISNEKEVKVNATAETLYKIAKAGGSVEGRFKEEIRNLEAGATVSEQGLVRLRTLYLFCTLVVNAQDISTERKVELYSVMMGLKSAPPQPEPTKPTTPRGVMDPARKEQLLRTVRESQDPLERARAVEALFPPPLNPGVATPELEGEPVMAVFRIGESALFGSAAEARKFVPTLGDYLSNDEQLIRLREESAHSLAKIGGREAMEALLAALAGSNYPAEVRASALHGPGRFWKQRYPALLKEFNNAAGLIIETWTPETCEHVSLQSRFRYIEPSLKNFVILCGGKRTERNNPVDR